MSVPSSGPTGTDATAQPGSDPSQNGVTPDAAGTSGAAASPAPEATGSDWFREAFAQRTGMLSTRTGDSQNGGGLEPKTETDTGKQNEPGKASEPATTSQNGSESRPYRAFQTQEEFDRAIQAETDRREAHRRARNQTEEDRRLLKEQPHEYVRRQQERLTQEEEEAKLLTHPQIADRISGAVNENVIEYDRQVLDPIRDMVPDSPEKHALMQNVGPGIEGRGKLARDLLNLLSKSHRAQARSELLKDEAFVKEILMTRGGQRAEPEVVSAVGAAPRREDRSQDSDMGDFIRRRR